MGGNGSLREVCILVSGSQRRGKLTSNGTRWIKMVTQSEHSGGVVDVIVGWMVVDGKVVDWVDGKNKKEEWMIATEKPPQSSSSKKIG